MEFETKIKVYIQTDNEGRILRCDGGYTTPADLTGWIEIDEGTGDKYNLCQSHYFDGGLYTAFPATAGTALRLSCEQKRSWRRTAQRFRILNHPKLLRTASRPWKPKRNRPRRAGRP